MPRSMQHIQPRNNQNQARGAAFYSDYEGEQSVYNFTKDYHWSQTEVGSQHSQTITSQGLLDLAAAKRLRRKN